MEHEVACELEAADGEIAEIEVPEVEVIPESAEVDFQIDDSQVNYSQEYLIKAQELLMRVVLTRLQLATMWQSK